MSQAFEWIRLGGPTMLLLVALSVATVTIVLVKLWEFTDQRIGDRRFVARALDSWQRGHTEQALTVLGASPSPLADVMREAITVRADATRSEAQMREYIEAYAAEKLESLRGLLRPLEVISQLAPLLGLLGTVLGMIQAFRQLQAAGDRVSPAILSGGLWEALLTTAGGLAVAIVALVAFSYLDRQIERLQQRMESALTALLTSAAR
jgi:biopolymer transport protein ExbB